MRRAVPFLLLLLGLASSAAADTIVLKNGRRIVAAAVAEEGDRVGFETPAGHMSLPKSIVARIEKGNEGTLFGPAHSMDASTAPISAPELTVTSADAQITKSVVHDEGIDLAYLSRLDNEASHGDRAAVEKSVAAHYAAAQFLTAKGDWEHAADHFRRALLFAPANVPLLLNLAVLDLRQSQFVAAVDPLEHARRVEPNSPEVAKLMGWAYYGQNKLDQAVEEWKRAERLHPDAEVKSALEKAERDRDEERSYKEGETAHFALRYYGGAAPELAAGILRTLERHFRDLASELDYEPRDPVGVILYTEKAFADITRAPAWVGALNDGRIRLPVQGLSSVTPELSRVLRHELAHSFISQKTRGRCPTWLQEGIAQWVEGRRSGDDAELLVTTYTRRPVQLLAVLEGPWTGFSGGSAGLAYSWSLAAVEMIVHEGGMSDVTRLLDQIAVSGSTDAALREVLHSSYADIDQQIVAYLRREYLH